MAATTSNEQRTTKPAFDYKAFNAFKKTPKYWGLFDAKNSKHRLVLSLLYQLEWTIENPKTERQIPDLERLGKWLQSDKAPVQKPLKKMDNPKPTQPSELSITLTALESMVGKKFDTK